MRKNVDIFQVGTVSPYYFLVMSTIVRFSSFLVTIELKCCNNLNNKYNDLLPRRVIIEHF